MRIRGLTLIVLSLVAALAVAFSGTVSAEGLSGAKFDQPLLITVVGQSADGQMVQVLARRGGLNFVYESLAGAGAVSGYRTLVLVVGGSSKGLGAAGIDPGQEEQRGKALIDAARSAGTSVIVMHVGGEARRGEITDRFIRSTAPGADYLIVVSGGNADGIFTKIAGENIPADYPASIGEAGNYLKASFR